MDGPVNGEIFLADIQQHLAPRLVPGDIVIMENLSSHKRAGIREAIEERQATLAYLPPDRPDLNPIELAFSKFKWLLKSKATRSVETLWNVCG